MLRNRLIDRFKIAVHMEDRPLNAYTLTAVNPKLAKADPTGRTGCKEGPAPAAKDPRDTTPILARLLTRRNITGRRCKINISFFEVPRYGRRFFQVRRAAYRGHAAGGRGRGRGSGVHIGGGVPEIDFPRGHRGTVITGDSRGLRLKGRVVLDSSLRLFHGRAFHGRE
jgi:hypothetical protein